MGDARQAIAQRIVDLLGALPAGLPLVDVLRVPTGLRAEPGYDYQAELAALNALFRAGVVEMQLARGYATRLAALDATLSAERGHRVTVLDVDGIGEELLDVGPASDRLEVEEVVVRLLREPPSFSVDVRREELRP